MTDLELVRYKRVVIKQATKISSNMIDLQLQLGGRDSFLLLLQGPLSVRSPLLVLRRFSTIDSDSTIIFEPDIRVYKL